MTELVDTETRELAVKAKSLIHVSTPRDVRNSYAVRHYESENNTALLRLFVTHLEAGETNLFDVSYSYALLLNEGVEAPEQYVTVPALEVYVKVGDTLKQAHQVKSSMKIDSVCAAVMVSGELDHEMISSLILERLPVDGEQFLEILTEVKGTATSLSSGVL